MRIALVFVAALGLQAQTDPVSIDLLRHPASAKVRRELQSAMAKAGAGDDESAIGDLQEALKKHPDAAPWVYNLLGVEYVKTDRFKEGVTSLEHAVALLPNDGPTRYNLALALICAGDYDRARQEVQKAVELEPGNAAMRARLKTLLEKAKPPVVTTAGAAASR